MKSFFPTLLLTLLLSACQANIPSTPVIITVTATSTEMTIATTEPTAIPETPEQIAMNAAQVAFEHGARPSNYESWQTIEGARDFYTIFENSADPSLVSNEDLESLDVFIGSLRQLTFEETVRTDVDTARNVLIATSKSAMYEGVKTPEEIAAMNQEQLGEYYASLNLDARGVRLTDEVLNNMLRRDQFLTPNEIIGMETDPNGQVLMSDNMNQGIVTGSGYYGFFEQTSQNPNDRHNIDYSYSVPLFGRNAVR